MRIVDHGLALNGGRLVFVARGGFGVGLPWSLRMLVATAWNCVACWLLGHDWRLVGIEPVARLIETDCPHCGKRLGSAWP